MPLYTDRDRNVTLHYEHAGDGFPLLLLPPGGLTADIAYWQRVAFNAFEIFQRGFHAIAVDERHAGQSFGPIELDDPWGGYARDHLGLMNHLGIERFHVLGSCIGSSHALRLIQLAPERVVSAVLVQPTGSRTYATFRLGDTEVVAELQAHDVSQPGESIDLAIDMNRVVIIDPTTLQIASVLEPFAFASR